MRARLVWTVFSAVLALGAAPADLVELRCDGTSYWYQDGFGAGAPIRAETTRIVKVDLASRKLTSDTLHGHRAAEVDVKEGSFSATLIHGFDHKGTRVYGEVVYINRYTGEMSSQYILSTDRDGKGYMAFVGECRRAERRF
jgi:hypothetical protein